MGMGGGDQHVFIIKRLMISICTILGVADVFIKYIFKINLIIYNTLNSGLCHIDGRGDGGRSNKKCILETTGGGCIEY